MKSIYISFCLLAMACSAKALSPALSISFSSPTTAQLSWPSNFTDWQLTSTTNLSAPANWQSVSQTPTHQGDTLVVLFPINDKSRFFRLVQGGSCVFHATPSVIAPGGTSTLSWCPVSGTTYRLSPGPGIMAGSSFTVSPAITTVYTLTASNASGVIPSLATVTVNSYSFANVSNWDGTLNFSYVFAATTSEDNYSVNHQGQLTFHLTRSMVSPTNAVYIGYASGNAQINDRMDDLTQMPIDTITHIGSGPPLLDVNLFPTSQLELNIDFTTGTYSFTIVLEISATYSTSEASVTESSWIGTVTVIQRTLPVVVGALSSSEFLPARGPLWNGGGDLFLPGDLVPSVMFVSGAVTDTTAGNASVDWSFVPSP